MAARAGERGCGADRRADLAACRSDGSVTVRRLFAADALLPVGWARDVLLEWNEAGRFVEVTPGSVRPADGSVADGPVIAGMPNLHSHAFQRAFGGLTEFRAAHGD